MSELKTQENDQSVNAFLDAVESDKKRQDCYTIAALMEKISGSPAKMWGDSIVGFGKYHYKYASGREGDWMLLGLSPRKQAITLYLMSGFYQFKDILQRLGKHKTGQGCLYIRTLEDVDVAVLEELIKKSVDHMRAMKSPN